MQRHQKLTALLFLCSLHILSHFAVCSSNCKWLYLATIHWESYSCALCLVCQYEVNNPFHSQVLLSLVHRWVFGNRLLFCILAGRSRFWQSRCPLSSDTIVHAYTNMQLPILCYFWPHVQYNERDILVHIIMLNFRSSLSGPELYYVA